MENTVIAGKGQNADAFNSLVRKDTTSDFGRFYVLMLTIDAMQRFWSSYDARQATRTGLEKEKAGLNAKTNMFGKKIIPYIEKLQGITNEINELTREGVSTRIGIEQAVNEAELKTGSEEYVSIRNMLHATDSKRGLIEQMDQTSFIQEAKETAKKTVDQYNKKIREIDEKLNELRSQENSGETLVTKFKSKDEGKYIRVYIPVNELPGIKSRLYEERFGKGYNHIHMTRELQKAPEARNVYNAVMKEIETIFDGLAKTAKNGMVELTIQVSDINRYNYLEVNAHDHKLVINENAKKPSNAKDVSEKLKSDFSALRRALTDYK